MSNFNQESVTSVHHWTDNLFSFTTTRDPSFRFRNGEFTMIGLKVGEKPLLRAYSVASANYEDQLEFFSIKVQDGPLTSRLQHLKVGDPIIVSRKATGTLVIDNLESGRNLYLVGTGTGLAPFLSVIKDPETYERFISQVWGRPAADFEQNLREVVAKDELLSSLIDPARFELTYEQAYETWKSRRERINLRFLAVEGKHDLVLSGIEAVRQKARSERGPRQPRSRMQPAHRRAWIKLGHGHPSWTAPRMHNSRDRRFAKRAAGKETICRQALCASQALMADVYFS